MEILARASFPIFAARLAQAEQGAAYFGGRNPDEFAQSSR